MLRKSKVFDCLKQMCQTVSIKQIMEGYEGVNAANLAAVLQMDRANVSKELNRLVQEKVVVKVIGRPVYYFDAKILQELSKTRLEQYEDWSYRSRKDNVRGNHVSLCQGTRCIR